MGLKPILALAAVATGMIWMAMGEPVASAIWHGTAFILVGMDDE